MTKIPSSFNHFFDTNVLLNYANGHSGHETRDIETILREAVGPNKKRNIWISSVLLAELRPSNFVPGVFPSVEELGKYIRSLATTVTPDPPTMMRVARLRDIKWRRSNPQEGEKSRQMSLGDAIHIASALWVKEACGVKDLEFLTFDDGRSDADDLDPHTRALSLLRLEEYTHELSGVPDVSAVVLLRRIRPVLSSQGTLPV